MVEPDWFVTDDGSLDGAGLLTAFQRDLRQHSESWVDQMGTASRDHSQCDMRALSKCPMLGAH